MIGKGSFLIFSLLSLSDTSTITLKAPREIPHYVHIHTHARSSNLLLFPKSTQKPERKLSQLYIISAENIITFRHHLKPICLISPIHPNFLAIHPIVDGLCTARHYDNI